MFLLSLVEDAPKSSVSSSSCLFAAAMTACSWKRDPSTVRRRASTMMGMRSLTGLTPALRMGIISLFAVSMDRKYVTANRNDMEATIIRYSGRERMMYSTRLGTGTEPCMIWSILEKSSTAASMSAKSMIVTMAILRIEKIV